ncbi:hypothetical protein ACQEVB_32500 [Pseudonocardia sp. CA-107938]
MAPLRRPAPAPGTSNPDRPPTWTALGVAALAMPGLFAEIKCTALLPD